MQTYNAAYLFTVVASVVVGIAAHSFAWGLAFFLGMCALSLWLLAAAES